MKKIVEKNEYKSALKVLVDAKQLAICSSGFTFNSYFGCLHDCQYCFSKGIHTRYGRDFSTVLGIADLVKTAKVFKDALNGKGNTREHKSIRHKYPVRIGAQTDGFQPIEESERITMRFIHLMNELDFPFVINTKSDLVADNEYLRLFKDNCLIQITLSTLNKKLIKQLEPNVPSPVKRLKAIEKLSKVGIKVAVRISPFIPGLTQDLDRLLDCISKAGAYHVIAEVLRFTPILLKNLKHSSGVDFKLLFEKIGNIHQGYGGYMRFPLNEKLGFLSLLRNKCIERGMSFSTCGDEDPSLHTTHNCCGFDGLEKFKGCSTATYVNAYKLSKQKGFVTLEDMKKFWSPDWKIFSKIWRTGYWETVLKNFKHLGFDVYKFLNV